MFFFFFFIFYETVSCHTKWKGGKPNRADVSSTHEIINIKIGLEWMLAKERVPLTAIEEALLLAVHGVSIATKGVSDEQPWTFSSNFKLKLPKILPTSPSYTIPHIYTLQ